MDSHASESISILGEPLENTSKLTLPWREEDFEIGTPSHPRTCIESSQSNGGLFCELIKAMTFWSAVNALVKASETNMGSRISAIHELDHRISQWWERLPVCLQLTPSSVSQIELDALPKLLLLHTVYHQSLAVVHASIVPLFSWNPGDETWLPSRQISAQIAFDHACAASNLFGAVLTQFSRLSAIPSFVAYAAYCGCAIQIPFLWCSDEHVREKAQRNVQINLKIINTLSQYWKLTSLLEIYVQYLYKVHAKTQTPLDNEPKCGNPAKLTGFKPGAANASKTILGFNRILWTNNGGYTKPGEELTDLSLGVRDEPEIQTTEEQSANQNPENERVFPFQNQYQNQQGSPAFASRINFTMNSTVSNWEEIHPELQASLGDSLGIDYFRPFDPNMTMLDGTVIDFSQFGSNGLDSGILNGFPTPTQQG